MDITITKDGTRSIVSTRSGRQWEFEDICPRDVAKIGERLNMLTINRELVFQCECSTPRIEAAMDQIDWVLTMGDGQIATARGQIEDAGCEKSLSDREVAIMDIYQRECLAENAREVDDPFNAHNSGPWSGPGFHKVPTPELQG